MRAAVFWQGHIVKQTVIWAMAGGAGMALCWKLVGPQGIDPLYAGLVVSAAVAASGWRSSGKQKTGR